MAKKVGDVYMKFSVEGDKVAVQKLDKVEHQVKDVGDAGAQAGGKISGAMKGLGALSGAIGIGMFVAQINSLLDSAEGLNMTVARLRGNLESRGAPPVILMQMQQVADSLERQVRIYSSREILEMMAAAVGAGANWNDVLEDTGDLLGVAVQNMQSLPMVAENYSKAMVGNAEGMKQIFRELEGLNQAELAQLNIRDLIRGKVSIAIAQAEEETAQVRQLIIQHGNLQESMGKVVAVGMVPMLNIVTPLMERLAKGPPILAGVAAGVRTLTPMVTGLAMAMHFLHLSTPVIGWIAGISTALGLGAFAWAGYTTQVSETLDVSKDVADEWGKLTKAAKEAGAGVDFWTSKEDALTEAIKKNKESVTDYEKELSKAQQISGGDISRAGLGYRQRQQEGKAQKKLNEAIREQLTNENLLELVQGQRQASEAKADGDHEKALNLELGLIELRVKQGAISLAQAEAEVQALLASAKTDEEKLALNMKLVELNERQAAQKQKEISYSENLRVLEAKLADIGTGRHDNLLKILDVIIAERKERGGTTGVLQLQLQREQMVTQEKKRQLALEQQRKSGLIDAIGEIQDQSKRAAQAAAEIREALDPMDDRERKSWLENQLEAMTGFRPDAAGGLIAIMDSIQEDMTSGSEAMVENGEKSKQTLLAWIVEAQKVPGELQVIMNAADRVAASFEGAFVEVFREGKFSLESFAKAFEMAVSQMAATVASRAAIFGLLSLLIPGGGAAFGAGGLAGKIFGFQEGGYTGPGGDEIKGVVHGNELVLPLSDKTRTTDLLTQYANRLPRIPLAKIMSNIVTPAQASGMDVSGLRQEIRDLRETVARQGSLQVNLLGKLEIDNHALRFQIMKAEREAGGHSMG